MGTAEWIALGLLLIALFGWLRWRGSPEYQREMTPPQVPKERKRRKR